MKRSFPSIIKYELTSNEEQKPLLGLQVRRKGKIDNKVYVYRQMVDSYGDEIERKNVVELSKFDDDNYDITKDIQFSERQENELIEEGIDDSISKKMNKKKYIYYEYFEMIESLGKTSDMTMMLINEHILMDQSEDTHDSEDSNSEGYYANSYPSTPSTSSEDEYREYSDDDEYERHYDDSDDFDDYGEYKKKRKHKDDYYDNYFGDFDSSSSDSDYDLNHYAQQEYKTMLKNMKMEEESDSDDEMNIQNQRNPFNNNNNLYTNNYNQEVIRNNQISEEEESTDPDEICILKRKKPKNAMEEESE